MDAEVTMMAIAARHGFSSRVGDAETTVVPSVAPLVLPLVLPLVVLPLVLPLESPVVLGPGVGDAATTVVPSVSPLVLPLVDPVVLGPVHLEMALKLVSAPPNPVLTHVPSACPLLQHEISHCDRNPLQCRYQISDIRYQRYQISYQGVHRTDVCQ